jgi:hypothetical protein
MTPEVDGKAEKHRRLILATIVLDLVRWESAKVGYRQKTLSLTIALFRRMNPDLGFAVRSLRRAGFTFLFYKLHCRIHFELDKDTTPIRPEFGPHGRSRRWHRRSIQLGKLNLDDYVCH